MRKINFFNEFSSLSVENMLWTFEGNYTFKRFISSVYYFYVYCFTHFTDRILFKDVLKMLPVSTFILASCLLLNLKL